MSSVDHHRRSSASKRAPADIVTNGTANGTTSFAEDRSTSPSSKRSSRREDASRKKAEQEFRRRSRGTSNPSSAVNGTANGAANGTANGVANGALATPPSSAPPAGTTDTPAANGTNAGSKSSKRKAAAGTVAGMKPSPVVALHESAKVFEAAAYMAAKRQDAVLITNSEGHLAGILTDKDLTYRVVAEGLDPRSTPVSQIMTRNPVSVSSTSNATDALNKMVAGHFRHLPVVDVSDDDETGGGVVGVLDITKCLYEALEKLDRAYESSRKLKEALEGVEREWSINSGNVGKYAEYLRDKLACPNLAGVLASEGATPPTVGLRASVVDAAKKMKQCHETAVLVFDVEARSATIGDGQLAGIFTSKDVVLRCLAAGLDPNSTTVIRVMTPHPDTVYPETSVMDALRKMHGMYRRHAISLKPNNLRKLAEKAALITLKPFPFFWLLQLNSIQNESGEGPMWSRFWDSALYQGDSASDSTSRLSSWHPSHAARLENRPNGAANSTNNDPAQQAPPMSPTSSKDPNEDSKSTVGPDDSASMFTGPTAAIAKAAATANNDSYVFKLKDEDTGKVHRFTCSSRNMDELISIIRSKVPFLREPDPEEQLYYKNYQASPPPVSVSYIDDEGDYVHLATDRDLEDAVIMAKALGWQKLQLSLDYQRNRKLQRNGDPYSGGASAVSYRSNGVAGAHGSNVVVASGKGALTHQRAASPLSDPSAFSQGIGGIFGLGSDKLVAPALIGGGIAVVCAFLLGRAFRPSYYY
ncbi:hypothetical protein HK102_012234 [Quaeritorhiza haematococci]|nr:hypothetical protein HK102_012234 [Quaeritorhiza haematococci]